jgi:hypothetical protein
VALAALLCGSIIKLQDLNLYSSNIDDEGVGRYFGSKVLCDTSSINETFLSNHTLEHLGDHSRLPDEDATRIFPTTVSTIVVNTSRGGLYIEYIDETPTKAERGHDFLMVWPSRADSGGE